MHPPSSSVRILQAKVTICQQKFVAVIILRVHHVPFTSLTISRLRTSPCVAVSIDTHVGLNVATRSCNVYPVKCWFAVLCRFWLQCSCTVREFPGSNNSIDFFCSVTLYNAGKLYDNTLSCALAASFFVYPYYSHAN
jgi:hypothetical protein